MIRCRSPRSLLLQTGPLRCGGVPRAGLVLLALVARAAALGPAPVELGTAGDFAILAKSGVSSVPSSVIVGDVGVSPITQTALTGFSLVASPDTKYTTSTQVIGKLYSASNAAPTPAKMTLAVGDMQTAYTDAAGRADADYVEYKSGLLGGETLTPGLYKFGTSVSFYQDCTLRGSATDTWIFQIAGGMDIAAGKKIILAGGASARNVVWVVAGHTTHGASSHFEGVILCATSAFFATASSIHGRVLVQTAVRLQQTTVTSDVPSEVGGYAMVAKNRKAKSDQNKLAKRGAPRARFPLSDGIAKAVDKSMDKPKAVVGSDKPKAVVGSDKPKAVVGSDKPKAVVDSDKPKAVVESDKPKAVVDSDKPKAVVEGDKAKGMDKSMDKDSISESDKAKAVVDSDKAKAVVDSDKPKAVVEGDKAKAVVEGDKAKAVVEGDKAKGMDKSMDKDSISESDKAKAVVEGDMDKDSNSESDKAKAVVEGDKAKGMDKSMHKDSISESDKAKAVVDEAKAIAESDKRKGSNQDDGKGGKKKN